MKQVVMVIIRAMFWILVGLFALPLIFIFVNSFASMDEMINRYSSIINEANRMDFSIGNMHMVSFSMVPDMFTLEQYKYLFLNAYLWMRMYIKSFILVIPILLGQFIIAPAAAFGFEFSKWKYKERVYRFYLLIMLLPIQVILVPDYIMTKILGIASGELAIILFGIFNPLGVFIIRQQLRNFPYECIEAAMLDGAGNWNIYTKIVRPNLVP